MKKSKGSLILILVAVIALGTVALLNLPSIQERLEWRVSELVARVKYSISPPEQVVFVPEGMPIAATPSITPTPTQPPSVDINQKTPEPSPVFLPTATITSTPIPSIWKLPNFRHEYQSWNNCGPATLAMALSYWGWDGDQRPVATFTKPNPRDKNVMPYEMADYVEEETPYEVILGVGGEVRLLKQFIAAGLPVIIEKGFDGPEFEGWMGHYVLVTGYSDMDQIFILQDSYYGPNQFMNYEELNRYWRAFNYTYLIVYPEPRTKEVLEILGLFSSENYRNNYAADKASEEIYLLTGQDQFFAWFNRGSSLVALQDYAGAALAYDQAFKVYPSIPEKDRPWRMLWYQTGPYWAYYYTGRYQDVINLATTTLKAMSEPVLEESYYWRAQAFGAIGDTEGAIRDLQTSLKYHPGFSPATSRLRQLNVDP